MVTYDLRIQNVDNVRFGENSHGDAIRLGVGVRVRSELHWRQRNKPEEAKLQLIGVEHRLN